MNATEIQLVITRTSAQALADYLVTKPYSEVAHLIGLLQQLQTVEKAGFAPVLPPNPAPADTYEGTVVK